MSLLKKMKRLLKFAVVVATDDSGAYPIIFNSYMGKPRSKAVNISPFGLWSRPPLGSLSFVMNGNGAESNQACISNDYAGRPIKDIEEGETVLGNKSSYVHFKKDGSVSLFINGTEIVTFATDGNMSMVADVSITGDLDVDGKITATGAIQGSEITDGSVPYTTHKHSDPQGGVTGTPQN